MHPVARSPVCLFTWRASLWQERLQFYLFDYLGSILGLLYAAITYRDYIGLGFVTFPKRWETMNPSTCGPNTIKLQQNAADDGFSQVGQALSLMSSGSTVVLIVDLWPKEMGVWKTLKYLNANIVEYHLDIFFTTLDWHHAALPCAEWQMSAAKLERHVRHPSAAQLMQSSRNTHWFAVLNCLDGASICGTLDFVKI